MWILLSCLMTIWPFASAEFSLTGNLAQSERVQIVKVLGLGTNNKNTSRPGGLGTNHGLEISIANEFIDTQKISQLIINDGSTNTLYYPKISIGKGIYDQADLFIHFIPYTATLGLSEFGGVIRYHFLRFNNSPLVTSLVVSANSSNFNNQLIASGLGADVSIGMNLDWLSVYSSVGWAQAKGTFVGGTEGVTDTLTEQSERVSTMHFSVGTLMQYKVYFISLALDHYYQPVYTTKIGFYF